MKHWPDNAITDPEEIRKIALNNEREKFHLIPKELQYIGLYPHIMKSFTNIKNKKLL